MDTETGFVEFAVARSAALFRTAWLLTGDWHHAEDLVQETLARLYPRWSKVAGADQPAAYAHTVMVRLFLSQRRRRSTREQPTDLLGRADRPVEDGDTTLRVALRDALAQLERTDRVVLVLRYWEDFDSVRTASLTGMTPAAVRTRCTRALVRLRAVLGDDLTDLSAR